MSGWTSRIPEVRALHRDRLTRVLNGIWEHRVLLVVAPAGSGKTTLLAEFVSSSDAPVAWYLADPAHGEPRRFLRRLRSAVESAIGGLDGAWESVDDAAESLERRAQGGLVLVVDDLHVLASTEAERALEALAYRLPRGVRILAGSRREPSINLARLRVSGGLLEIGPDDLRFRSWEVERLFRDFYQEPLPPEDLATLARRTEGWAAALQLFHLATSGKPSGERKRLLDSLALPSRLVGDYLATNVLDELPEALRAFLIETSVLTRLSADLCDRLLDRTGSDYTLQELARRRIFTSPIVGTPDYRYHEVFRLHLEDRLARQVGEEDARRRYRKAGRLLLAAGAVVDAARAFIRAEDWASLRDLMPDAGEALADHGGMSPDGLPASVMNDPWVQLAKARRLRAAGRFQEAMAAYRQIQGQETPPSMRRGAAPELASGERRALGAWLERSASPSNDWCGLLRRAVERNPLAVVGEALRLTDSNGRLVAGLSLLIGGHVRDAQDVLTAVYDNAAAGSTLAVAARLGAGIAALLADDRSGSQEIEWVAEECDRLDFPWLARVARASLAMDGRPDGPSEAAALRLASERANDEWGAAIADLFEGIGRLVALGEPRAVLTRAAGKFERLGAATLAAWAGAALAIGISRAGDPEAAAHALAAEAAARAHGVRGAQGFAFAALAETGPSHVLEYGLHTEGIQDECGVAVVRFLSPQSPASRDAPEVVQCFAGFDMRVNGVRVDLESLRPRARAMLRLLSLRAGRPAHREAIIEALWPDVDPVAGTRNLHVAVSSIRRALDGGKRRSQRSLIQRDGDAYRLALSTSAFIDIVEFNRSIETAAAARSREDWGAREAALRTAIDLYRGELFPEEGPAEWVVEAREHYRAAAVDASIALAELAGRRGRWREAVHACERGLSLDRFDDRLWKSLIDAHQRAEDPAAAARAAARYDELLEELGVERGPRTGEGGQVGTARRPAVVN